MDLKLGRDLTSNFNAAILRNLKHEVSNALEEVSPLVGAAPRSLVSKVRLSTSGPNSTDRNWYRGMRQKRR